MVDHPTEIERFAIEYGLDLTLTIANMELSVEDRIAAHERAKTLVLEIQHAGKNLVT